MKKSNYIVFDSSALFSIASDEDSNHQLAAEISQKLFRTGSEAIIPNDVFSEVLNIIGKKLGREKQLDVAEDLMSGFFSIVESNDEIRTKAIDKLKGSSRSVSFTDCVVMAFADYYETKEIFGFDEVFEKAGYQLPRD